MPVNLSSEIADPIFNIHQTRLKSLDLSHNYLPTTILEPIIRALFDGRQPGIAQLCLSHNDVGRSLGAGNVAKVIAQALRTCDLLDCEE